jgi:uncharacterized protein YndB with AHSA1/START domain
MIRSEAAVSIARPVETVFDLLADPRNEPSWLPGARRVAMTTPEPVRLGSRFEGEYARAGKVTIELVAFERPSRVTFRAVSKIVRFDDAVTLAAENGGTRLDAVMEAAPQGVMRLLAPLMGRTMRAQFAANWLALKRFVEAEPTG